MWNYAPMNHMMTLKQEPYELLMAYVQYFNDEVMQVEDYINQVAL